MRLIDADELKEAMREHTDYRGYLVCDPEEIIDLAPTVERPHGEWIYIGISETTGLKIVKCTSCKKRQYGSTDFCSNCGADMRKEGEQNGEN